MTRTVNDGVHVARQYVIATGPRRSHATRMDVKYLNQRERLTLFFREHQPLSRNAVCKKSGASESAIGAFMRGKGKRVPRTLSVETYKKLSAWSHWTVAELMAEAPPPKPEDITSRKNASHGANFSEKETMLRKDEVRTTDGLESEGSMEHQLRLELVERVWDLPADRLASLKRHFDAIELAMAELRIPPRVRGKTAE